MVRENLNNKERIVIFGKYKSLIGILSDGSNLNSSNNLPGILLLNSGLIHRVGPSRIYVKLSRYLAEKGFNVLRFDLSGIGDSTNLQANRPLAESVVEDTIEAMDYLGDKHGISRFVLIGICDGASISLKAACHDKRVKSLVLVNLWVPDTLESKKMTTMNFYWRAAFFRRQSWLKFISGKSSYRELFGAMWYKLKGYLLPRERISEKSDEVSLDFHKSFQLLNNYNTRLLIISSGIDIGSDFLKAKISDLVKEMSLSGQLQMEHIPFSDHTFTSLNAQSELIELIKKWL